MGYIPVLSEADSPWPLRSSSGRKGATEDVERKKQTASLPCLTRDVPAGTAGHEQGRVLPEVTCGIRASGNGHCRSAPHHANFLLRRFSQDAAGVWDTVAASLPSFYGVGWAEEQGKRSEMEDGTVVIRDFGGMPGAWLLAIYDGHGGRATVSFLLQRLHENLLQLLQERGDRRWKCLQRHAQCRRSVVAGLLNQQQQRLQAQLRCKPRRKHGRLRLQSQRQTQIGFPRAKSSVPYRQADIQVPSATRPGSNEGDGAGDERKGERIGGYRGILRTHQLLRVLRWMEEAGEHSSADTSFEDESCLPPHYLLVCTEEDVQSALSDAFRQTDEQLLQQGIVQSGATACVSLLRPCIEFERLISMRPEDFTDEDWKLFCGQTFALPFGEKRFGEESAANPDESEYRSTRWSHSYSQSGPPAERGTNMFTTENRCGATPPSTAEHVYDFPQVDAAQVPILHGGVEHTGPPVDAARCVYNPSHAGCTVTEASAKSSLLSIKLSVAHLGDSRALLVASDGSCERLTAENDHKASSSQEVQRVEEAGGWVFGERVNGMLAIGRAFGDWCLKLNPEELKVFSAAAGTGANAERAGCSGEKINGTDGMSEPAMAASCKDTALFHMLPEGMGGYTATQRDAAASLCAHADEGGARRTEDAREAAGMKLGVSHTGRGKEASRDYAPSLARQPALVVSNQPDICTRNLPASQSANFTAESTLAPAVGIDSGVGSEAPAGGTSDSGRSQEASYSTHSRGLTSPPVLLLLGCDGLFDVCSDHAVTTVALQFLKELQEAHPDLSPSNAAEAVARALIEEAITFRGSTDNVSVTVALLLPMEFYGSEDASEV